MDKIKVRRANVVLDILPEDKDYYMGCGYSVVDNYGNVVEESLPDDAGTLKVRIGELTRQLEAANATIVKLKADMAKLNKEQNKQKRSKE